MDKAAKRLRILAVFAFLLYTLFICRKDWAGAGLLAAFLGFSLITGAFSVLNVF